MIDIGASSRELNIEFGGYSTAGIKPKNQDAFAAHQPKSYDRIHKGVAVTIADGLSCSEHSAEASQMCVTHFIEDYYSTPDSWSVGNSVSRVLNALNTWLVHHGSNTHNGTNSFATTFSTAIFKSTSAHLFHVGDSRIYRCRNHVLEQLTQDHSLAREGSSPILTNAIGTSLNLQVDYLCEDIQENDLFLLSTDGVHDFLSHKELTQLLLQPNRSLEAQAQQIINHALNHGSNDNLSCLLARVITIPVADINETHRQLSQYAIPPALEPDMSIDGYRVIEVLCRSTRSHLYRVKHDNEEIEKVLKAPSENYADDPQYLEAFIREQWVGKRIKHPNVMAEYSRPEETRFLYNLSEYIEGRDLRQWMYDNPSPPVEQVRIIIEQIATALRAFQRMSMIHRDLKPENIMITSEDQIKLIDFGTVQVSGLQEIISPLNEECPVGSVNYIAPEYLMHEQGLFRSDIFSLGVITYEMLCGKLPYKQSAYKNSIPKHYSQWRYIRVSEYRKDIPVWVDAALKKATAPSPKNRYAALSEFIQDMRVPNQTEARKLESSPLIERNTTRFWQLLCLILCILLVLSNIP